VVLGNLRKKVFGSFRPEVRRSGAKLRTYEEERNEFEKSFRDKPCSGRLELMSVRKDGCTNLARIQKGLEGGFLRGRKLLENFWAGGILLTQLEKKGGGGLKQVGGRVRAVRKGTSIRKKKKRTKRFQEEKGEPGKKPPGLQGILFSKGKEEKERDTVGSSGLKSLLKGRRSVKRKEKKRLLL